MKASLLCAVLCCVAGVASADADPPSPDVAQIGFVATIPAGLVGSENQQAFTVPAGKRLVVQSMSWVRNFAPSGSVGHSFITYKINGVTAYAALPDITSDGSISQAATTAATFYANAGTQIDVSLARTGDVTDAENDNISIVGYYVTP